MTENYTPPRYQDYLRPRMEPEPAPMRVHGPSDQSTIFVMLVDREPPLAPIWQGSDQCGCGILGKFESPDRDEVITWAKERPNVKTIYLYSEEDGDIHPLD